MQFAPIKNIIVSSIVFCLSYALIFYTSAHSLGSFKIKLKLLLQISKIFALFITGSFLFLGVDILLNKIGFVPFAKLGPAPFPIDLLRSLIAVSCGTLYRYFTDIQKMEKKQSQLILENTKMELQLLKNQINPHFLFNTLNNLYGLTYNKSDKAPEVVLMMSDTLRYVIYETQKILVPLHKEIEFLNNYIKLESLRFPEGTQISLNTDIPQNDLQIAHMLLLPFIENCFKHSDLHSNKNGKIEIYIWLEDKTLQFSCENSFNPNKTTTTSGIGIENTIKRLNIIYGKNYQYSYHKEDNIYYTQLTILLALE